jgi:outer membrane receptor protein involved in Fe transport
VFSNLYDALPDLYTTFYNNISDPAESKGWAVFGEAYFDITDTVKLTVGLRYNEDKKSVQDTTVLVGASDLRFAPCFQGDFANCSLPAFGGQAEPLWSRVPDLVQSDAGEPLEDAGELALIELYGQSGALDAALATPAYSLERLAISAAVPLAPPYGEARALSGSPSKFKWDEFTGRIGLDWQFSDNAMVYAFYSRGYKPGGLNPAIPTQFQSDVGFSFEKEKIDSFEVGVNSTLMDGQMVLNGTFFTYDYSDLQVARIKFNTGVNENIDADIMGTEVEFFFRPDALPGLQIDAAYSWLDTEVQDTLTVDVLDRTGGNPDYIALNNFGFHYAVNEDQLNTPGLLPTLAALGASVVPGVINPETGLPFYPTATPGVLYPDGTPVFISQSALDAVGALFLGEAWEGTTEGVPVDLSGNSLPNAPEHTIHLGLAYTFQVPALAGSLTARWDYYWQDDTYGREFNTIGDKIDSWDQHNASLIYESDSGQWTVRAWIRNIGDEDNVTGHYLTTDTSGYFRNYFVTEPRVYGASVRFNFGG